jgi:hypothetical protein
LTIWEEGKKGRKEERNKGKKEKKNKVEEDGFHEKGENVDLSKQDTPVKRESESYL